MPPKRRQNKKTQKTEKEKQNAYKNLKKRSKPGFSKGALVIGGGISGIQAALDLADAGIMTYVIERSTSIGGRMAQLDKTFPTNDCAMCILSPKMVAAARHPNIQLLTNSEVSKVSGSAGNYSVKVIKHPRYLDEKKCVGCGECAAKCPSKVENDFDSGLSQRKAIFLPFPQAVPMVYCIDEENCIYLQKGKCGVCAKLCKADAIDFDQKPQEISLDIGAIIVATGYDQYDPSSLYELGYKVGKNVITGLEFERLLNASGPTGGKIIRPSDGKVPKSILFVQCVGSRDIHNAEEYCSRICCMYAIKEALIAKEHQAELDEITILGMEIRAYGKGFEEYYQRAIREGVDFIKGRAAHIYEDEKTGEVIVEMEDVNKGELSIRSVDLVILSSAVIPNSGNNQLAEILKIELDSHGFFKENSLPATSSESTRTGIFLSGCAQGPKDIPDSVAQGSAAAALVEKYLKDDHILLVPDKDLTVPKKTGGDAYLESIRLEFTEPRIGVFVCHCGINIGGILDVPELVEYSRGLSDVVFATDNLYTCSDDAQRYIQDMIKEHNLTRVVVASCTPRTHEPIFKDTCARAGLNPYLFDMTNIRDQCSWVHMNDPEAATEKGKDLINMAVARARLLVPLKSTSLPVDQSVVVIGGGIGGIQCAIDLGNQGIKTTLIESSSKLGGRLNTLHHLANIETSPDKLISGKITELDQAGVKIIQGFQLKDIQGYVGNFDLTLESNSGKKNTQKSIHAGAIVLAIGASLHDPELNKNYYYGKYKNVITNLEFESLLKKHRGKKLGKDVVFIQCVGAREHDIKSGNTSCSRYCCQTALNQAKTAAEAGARVTVLHRGIRAFSKYAEELYYHACEAGVRFVQFPNSSELASKITKKGSIIEVHDISLNQDLELPADVIVLSLAMVPNNIEVEKLQKWLKIPCSADGFFLELHPKLAPVETNTIGIYLCGCAQGPKDVIDTLSQASAAAAKAAALVSNKELTTDPITANVNEAICWGCGTCEELCAYGAAKVDDTDSGVRISKVNSALCKGCGVCASNCPSGAMTIMHFTNDQIKSMIKAFGFGKVAN